MNLRAIGCSFRSAPVEIRERLAFDDTKLTQALMDLNSRYGCEAVLVSTCNRVELYLAKTNGEPPPDADLIVEFFSEIHGLAVPLIRPHFYQHADAEAVQHLFRVTASLDSMIVGEGQIAAQIRKAFELSQKNGTTGLLLNTLFPHAVRAAKRARTETGISQGHVSVSSVAVDYVRQVFDHFGDKTILVIGAGKMGQLTLKHLQELKPQRILVTNRSPEKAEQVAQGCNGQPILWNKLDEGLIEADIVLSTTGSPELIMTASRYQSIRWRRSGRPLVILDIAVPRDFDGSIHDGDTTFLFNIDDLQKIREQTIAKRRKHIAAAEQIIEHERKKFVEDWSRRRNGPIIAKMTKGCDDKRQVILENLFSKLNGKLTEADRAYIEGAFRLFQNQLLHGPIDALREASRDGTNATMLEAIRKMFQLHE